MGADSIGGDRPGWLGVLESINAKALAHPMDKELLKWGIEHSDPEKLKNASSNFDPKTIVQPRICIHPINSK